MKIKKQLVRQYLLVAINEKT